jgi:hypothetical protein
MQAKGRLQQPLGTGISCRQKEDADKKHPVAKTPAHERSFGPVLPIRKVRSQLRGFVLLEAMISLAMLTAIGLILLKLSLNILVPRQWTLKQSVTDAYLTYERAYAERIPFDDLLANNSPWPDYPTVASTTVEVGRLPGGVPITGTVTRTRFADTGNYPINGGTGTVATNPAAMNIWRVQSVLVYQVGNRPYSKARTVLRSQ